MSGPRRRVRSFRPLVPIVVALLVAAVTTGAGAIAPAPVIAGMSRHAGPTAGDYGVVIRGHNLGAVRSVYFGHMRAAAFDAVSSTEVIARAPRAARDITVHVQVRTTHGSNPLGHPTLFRYVRPPGVVGLSTHGSLPAGGRLTVYGHDLRDVRRVTMGDSTARITASTSATQLSIVAPAHDVGVVSVIVSTAFGTSVNTSYDNFRYAPRPVVTYVRPEQPAASPHSVEISGDNLLGATSVRFGSSPGKDIEFVNDDEIIATPTARAAGTVRVTVTTPSGSSAAGPGNVLLLTSPNPERWRARDRYDVFRGQMQDISCPSATECVAIDDATSTSMSSGHWGRPVRVGTVGALLSISCASVSLCVAVDSGGNAFIRTDGPWSQPTQLGAARLDDVACSTQNTCLAVAEDGNGYAFSRGTWSGPFAVSTEPDGGRLAAVSCPSATLCVAVSTGGDAFVWNGTSFGTAERIDDRGSVTDVSCPTTDYCVAVDQFGYAVTWDGTAWGDPVTVFVGDNAEHVSCNASKRCAALSYGSLAATFDGRSWTATTSRISPPTHPDAPEPEIVTAVSCPDATRCIALDRAGDTIDYDGASWAQPNLTFVTMGYADGLSCPTSGFCLSVDSDGNAYSAVDGVWGPPQAVLPGLDMRTDVSCADRSHCLMVTSDGTAAAYDGTAWRRVDSPPSPASSVSCPTSSVCLTADARFDGQHWRATSASPIDGAAAQVSCATTAFCVAVTDAGSAVWNGTTWTASAQGGTRVSCPAAGFCVSTDYGGSAHVYRDGAWGAVIPLGEQGTTAVSCTSTSYCQLVDTAGHGRVFDGTTWSNQILLRADQRAFAFDVSCPVAHRCVAMGRGTVFTVT